jgi:hypothetical protein
MKLRNDWGRDPLELSKSQPQRAQNSHRNPEEAYSISVPLWPFCGSVVFNAVFFKEQEKVEIKTAPSFEGAVCAPPKEVLKVFLNCQVDRLTPIPFLSQAL